MERIKLTVKGLTKDVEDGLTRKEIAAKYGLAQTQISKAMDMAGLKGVRAKSVKFELIDDEEDIETPEIVTEAPAVIAEPMNPIQSESNVQGMFGKSAWGN